MPSEGRKKMKKMKKMNTCLALYIGSALLLVGCDNRPATPVESSVPATGIPASPITASTSPTSTASPIPATSPATSPVTYSVEIPEGGFNGVAPSPEFVAVDNQDNAYIADRSRRILKIAPDGKVVDRWDVESSPDPGPEGLAVDSAGNIYVSDGGLGRIIKLSPGGKVLMTWEVPADSAPRHSHLLATDRQDNVYMVHYRTDRLLKYAPIGELVFEWRLEEIVQGRQQGELKGPTGVAVASDGTIYVVNHDNQNILKYSSAGKLLTKLGSRGSKPGEFDNPERVAVDGQGNVYVSDGMNYRVQELTPAGRLLAIWRTGELYPAGIAVDRKGNIYLGGWNKDTDQRIALVKFAPDGKVLNVWR
jgi:sugar lactone lactonase YvrE